MSLFEVLVYNWIDTVYKVMFNSSTGEVLLALLKHIEKQTDTLT